MTTAANDDPSGSAAPAAPRHAPTTRRYPRWADAVACSVAALWPIAITLAVLGSPSRYDPYALYSGLGSVRFHTLAALPTVDPNVYATAYTLGVRSASLLVHGHLPWWNPFEGLGAPLAGEAQSGAFFPFTPLLLLHDGSLVFHLALEAVAGVATFWLLRALRCNPLVAALGGMLYATNGTFAWLQNAAFNPVCFVPLLLLGVERARRAAARGEGGGWRWLAVGAAMALLAGFVETAALALVFAVVVAVQRAWALEPRARLALARKVLAGAAAGIAIAAPLLVAFGDYLQQGYVYEHAGSAASETMGGAYLAMSVSPYLFGRILQSAYPDIHLLWGGVGGYAGFAVLSLAFASLLGRRDRGLRLVLGAWVALSLADAVGLPGLRQLLGVVPVVDHIVLYRYLPPTWELAIVVLAALALRDAATATRTQCVVAVTVGVLATACVLLLGLALEPGTLQATRATTATSYDRSILLVVLVAAAVVLAASAPRRVRGALAGAVAVLEAGVLFAVPLQSWPSSTTVDQGVVRYLTEHVGTARFFSLGAPAANFGTQVGLRQLDVVDLPVPTANLAIYRELDPSENATVFSGTHGSAPGSSFDLVRFFHHLVDYERLGVEFVVAPTSMHLFAHRPVATLAYRDGAFEVWQLAHYRPLVRVPSCRVTATGQDTFDVHCRTPSVLLRTELDLPGWSATVNGVAVPVRDAGRFQAVDVPKGASTVALTFLPPGVAPAGLGTLGGLASLLVPWSAVAQWRRRRRARAQARAGLEELGAHLGRRPEPRGADATFDPPTGAVPIGEGPDADQEDPATSVVPAVLAGGDGADGPPTTAVELSADGPPTSAVPATRRADPPTISVPRIERAATDDPPEDAPPR